jgi:hypothetical protein
VKIVPSCSLQLEMTYNLPKTTEQPHESQILNTYITGETERPNT